MHITRAAGKTGQRAITPPFSTRPKKFEPRILLRQGYSATGYADVADFRLRRGFSLDPVSVSVCRGFPSHSHGMRLPSPVASVFLLGFATGRNGERIEVRAHLVPARYEFNSRTQIRRPG